MNEHNALGYWSGLALCLTKVRSSRARCPATALILFSGSRESRPYFPKNQNKNKSTLLPFNLYFLSSSYF